MNDVDILTKLIEEEPGNTIVASMLLDELMDARDMLPEEAAKHVEGVRSVAQDAQEMRVATGLIGEGSKHRARLFREISCQALVSNHAARTVLVVPGPSEPEIHTPRSASGMAYWGTVTITVGARWLIGLHETIQAVKLPVPKKARKRRAAK